MCVVHVLECYVIYCNTSILLMFDFIGIILNWILSDDIGLSRVLINLFVKQRFEWFPENGYRDLQLEFSLSFFVVSQFEKWWTIFML